MNFKYTLPIVVLCISVVGGAFFVVFDQQNNFVLSTNSDQGSRQLSTVVGTVEGDSTMKYLQEQILRVSKQQADMRGEMTELARLLRLAMANDTGQDSAPQLVTNEMSKEPNDENNEPNPDEIMEQFQAEMQFMDSEFILEQPDEQWSTTAEMEISEKFDSDKFKGAQLQSADCRTNLCRLEVSHADMESIESFTEELMFALKWDTDAQTMVVEGDESGSETKIVMFMSRDGQPLPQFNEVN